MCEHLGASFVQGAVTKVEEKAVTVSTGGSTETMECDAVVVAAGGYYANGGFWKAREAETSEALRRAGLAAERAKAEAAKSIVVVGAGLAGVEVAGEIKSKWPDKNVTLVGTFLAAASPFSAKCTEAALKKMGVVMKPGRVDVSSHANGKITTSKGEELDADVVLSCVGFVFAGPALLAGGGLAADANLKKNGQLICKPTLQLATAETVFACGDILAVPEGCFANVGGVQHCDDTAKVVAKNVLSVISGEPAAATFAWSKKPVTTPCMTALGPNVGIGDLGLPGPHLGLGDFMAKKVKCGDFYLGIQLKSFGKGITW